MRRFFIKKFICGLLTAPFLFVSVLPDISSAEFKKTKIAVMDFQLQGEGDETASTGWIIAEWLTAALVKEGRFDVVEKRLLLKIIEENKSDISGINENTLLKIGKALGAKILITGSVMRFRKMTEVNVRIIEVESASIVTTESVKAGETTKLEDAVAQTAEKIIKNFPLEGYIVKRNGNNVLIDLGRRAGVKQGTQFIVYKEGKVIKHPKTGEILDIERIETGKIGVKEAKDKISEGIILSETSAGAIKDAQLLINITVLTSPEIQTASVKQSEGTKQNDEESEGLYKKALALKEDGNYEASFEILNKLAQENPENINYQISYTDILLDQAVAFKESNNPGWKTKAKEAGVIIKKISRLVTENPDYCLVYAKYSWIVESRRESNITSALKKALYYRRDYSNAYILKGDIYFDLAKNASPERPENTITLTGGYVLSQMEDLAETARSAYESALLSADISDKKKVYVYYKIGEIEDRIFENKTNARLNWEKAFSLYPDSRIGRLVKERLNR